MWAIVGMRCATSCAHMSFGMHDPVLSCTPNDSNPDTSQLVQHTFHCLCVKPCVLYCKQVKAWSQERMTQHQSAIGVMQSANQSDSASSNCLCIMLTILASHGAKDYKM